VKSVDMMQHVTNDENPGCSHLFRYRGVRCSQSPRVFASLDTLHAALPDASKALMIVEIGTLYGAFTRVLRDHDISNAATIHTFDIVVDGTIIDGVHHHMGDVFKQHRRTSIDLIQSPGRCIVLCDGGDKVREFSTFSAFLKPGDLILAHDYVISPKIIGTSAAAPRWTGYEVTYDDIKDAIVNNGLEPFVADEMQRAMWACYVKTVT
jgi:hypothetical protein